MSTNGATPIQRLQVISVSVVGTVAGICFLVSLVVAEASSDTWRTFATIAAVACAIIGVSFLLTFRLQD